MVTAVHRTENTITITVTVFGFFFYWIHLSLFPQNVLPSLSRHFNNQNHLVFNINYVNSFFRYFRLLIRDILVHNFEAYKCVNHPLLFESELNSFHLIEKLLSIYL